MKEVWIDIEGYEGLYQVSSKGRVRNNKKLVLRQRKRGDYLAVNLYKNRECKTFSVHRLVAIAFIPKEELEELEVNHIKGKGNSVDNLEWVTSKENTAHAMKYGKQKMLGEDNSSAKLTEKEVIAIRNSNLTQKELSLEYNVTTATICSIVNRRTWKHVK